MIAIIPRLVSVSAIDPDVTAWEQAVIAAGGSVSTGTRGAVNQFTRAAKAVGLWDKLYAADMCAGDGLTSAIVRLKVPDGVSRSYTNTNFVSGDYTERGSGGGLVGNTTTKHLDTGINPSTLGYSVSSFGMWCYAREVIVGTGNTRVTMGVLTTGGTNITTLGWLSAGTAETGFVATADSTQGAVGSATSLTGFLGIQTSGSRVEQFYQNGVAVGATGTAAGAFHNGSIFKHAVNMSGTPTQWSPRRLSSSFITQGLSAGEVTALNSIVQAFETAMGRNV
jgi:hypothetical protein